MHTKSGAPLASDLADFFIRSFKAKSLNAELAQNPQLSDIASLSNHAKNQGATVLQFTLLEWKTDQYLNAQFMYSIKLTVANQKGDISSADCSGKFTLSDNNTEAEPDLNGAIAGILDRLLSSPGLSF